MPYPKNGPDKQQGYIELCMPAVILWQQAYTADRVKDQGATLLGCLRALPSEKGWYKPRVGRFMNVNQCHAFKYKSLSFFPFLKFDLLRIAIKIDCVHAMLVLLLFFYIFVRHAAGLVWSSRIAASPLCLRCRLTARIEVNPVSSCNFLTPRFIHASFHVL